MISTLAEDKLKYPGGRPPSAPTTQAPIEVEEPEKLARKSVISPQQKLEQAIAQEPQNANNYVELAQLLLEARRFDAAESLLNRGIANCGELGCIVERLEQIYSLRKDEQRTLNEKRAIEKQKSIGAIRMPWLELGVVVAVIALVIQLVPSVRAGAWALANFRQWSSLGWMAFNATVLFGLIAVRFGPELLSNKKKAGRSERIV